MFSLEVIEEINRKADEEYRREQEEKELPISVPDGTYVSPGDIIPED